jgi:hypothetical protein
MTQFLYPPITIPWRYLGRSALRITLFVTASGMMAAGDLL